MFTHVSDYRVVSGLPCLICFHKLAHIERASDALTFDAQGEEQLATGFPVIRKVKCQQRGASIAYYTSRGVCLSFKNKVRARGWYPKTETNQARDTQHMSALFGQSKTAAPGQSRRTPWRVFSDSQGLSPWLEKGYRGAGAFGDLMCRH